MKSMAFLVNFFYKYTIKIKKIAILSYKKYQRCQISIERKLVLVELEKLTLFGLFLSN